MNQNTEPYADVARELEDGMKREPGDAAHWRRQYEAALQTLGDLAAEHAETVAELERLRADNPIIPDDAFDDHADDAGVSR